MTTAAPIPASDRLGGVGYLAAAGSAIVFLLASAVLLNGLANVHPLPAHLRNWAVIAHLGSVMLALPLGVSQLVLPKGTIRHRTIGYIWVGLMTFTALVSFAVHGLNGNRLSLIHVLSAFTLVSAPMIVVAARAGRVAQHKAGVYGLILGGLVIAGLLTFIPGRILSELAAHLFTGR